MGKYREIERERGGERDREREGDREMEIGREREGEGGRGRERCTSHKYRPAHIKHYRQQQTDNGDNEQQAYIVMTKS